MLRIEKHPSFKVDALPGQALFESLACPIDRWILGGQQLADPGSYFNKHVLSAVAKRSSVRHDGNMRVAVNGMLRATVTRFAVGICFNKGNVPLYSGSAFWTPSRIVNRATESFSRYPIVKVCRTWCAPSIF
jgi:hypothetical protein